MQALRDQQKDVLQVVKAVQADKRQRNKPDRPVTAAAPISPSHPRIECPLAEEAQGADRLRTAAVESPSAGAIQYQYFRKDDLEDSQAPGAIGNSSAETARDGRTELNFFQSDLILNQTSA